MTPPLDHLRAFREAVEAGVPSPALPGPALERLRAALDEAERHLRELERTHLVAAFLGGTGVGKSTLLNALAEREISRAGDRRPTTDRVVCYRHRDGPLPEWLSPEDLASPGPEPHGAEALRGVLLLDLPDMDSRVPAHRGAVHRLVPRLDLLVVVASVDKYADRILYRELRALPQAPRNLAFVLNAVDRLRPEEVAPVVRDFAAKLGKHAGVAEPTLFALSALGAAARDRDPGQFSELRAYLDALARSSRRRDVLAANAERALARLERTWAAAYPPEEVEGWLEALARVPTAPPEAPPAFRAGLEDRLLRALEPWVAERALAASWFPVGPLHFFLRRLRGRPVPAGRGAPPLAGGDPCADLAERMVARPVRLAAAQARAAQRPLEGRLAVAIPDGTPASGGSPAPEVERWWEEVAHMPPRLAWRWRQHLVPAGTALLWIGWVVARGVRAREAGAGLLRSAAEALLAAAESFSPATLVALVGVLVLYSLLVYPYCHYRVHRAVGRAVARGARLYLEAWRRAYLEAWGDPFRQGLEAARAWWREAGRRLHRLLGKP
ncbi:MAG: hypothetical protein Kow0092_09570 [Deferrisomatales bacterium]